MHIHAMSSNRCRDSSREVGAAIEGLGKESRFDRLGLRAFLVGVVRICCVHAKERLGNASQRTRIGAPLKRVE